MLYLVRVWLRYNFSVCVVVGVCVWFVRFCELTVVWQESRPRETLRRARGARGARYPRRDGGRRTAGGHACVGTVVGWCDFRV